MTSGTIIDYASENEMKLPRNLRETKKTNIVQLSIKPVDNEDNNDKIDDNDEEG